MQSELNSYYINIVLDSDGGGGKIAPLTYDMINYKLYKPVNNIFLNNPKCVYTLSKN